MGVFVNSKYRLQLLSLVQAVTSYELNCDTSRHATNGRRLEFIAQESSVPCRQDIMVDAHCSLLVASHHLLSSPRRSFAFAFDLFCALCALAFCPVDLIVSVMIGGSLFVSLLTEMYQSTIANGNY